MSESISKLSAEQITLTPFNRFLGSTKLMISVSFSPGYSYESMSSTLFYSLSNSNPSSSSTPAAV